jgi:hypothetical protein
MPSQRTGQFCRQAGVIVPGEVDQDGLAEVSGAHAVPNIAYEEWSSRPAVPKWKIAFPPLPMPECV